MKPVLTLRLTSGLRIQLVVFTCRDKSATLFERLIDIARSILRARSSSKELEAELANEFMLRVSAAACLGAAATAAGMARTLSMGTISP